MHDRFTPTPDWVALARYLSGESEPGEAEAVRRWIAASPERPPLVDALRQVWAEAAGPRQEWDVEAALLRIMDNAPGLASKRQVRPRPWLRWAAVAAAAVAIVAFGLLLGRPGTARYQRYQTVATLPMREYVTPRGQYAKLVLVDGSRITLAPLSQLRVPRDFEGATRDVYLEGQALFKIAHDPKRVFRVHTTRAIATDLGTTFVVRAYTTDTPQVDVLVTEGLVSLAAHLHPVAQSIRTAPLVLRPGDLGRVSDDGTLDTEHGVSPDAYTAWAEGRLVFQHTPLREVAAELSRWYDIEVRITDSATATRRVTASFHGEPAPEVLRLVALSLGLRYERQGHVVVLAPREPPNRSNP